MEATQQQAAQQQDIENSEPALHERGFLHSTGGAFYEIVATGVHVTPNMFTQGYAAVHAGLDLGTGTDSFGLRFDVGALDEEGINTVRGRFDLLLGLVTKLRDAWEDELDRVLTELDAYTESMQASAAEDLATMAPQGDA